MATRCSTRWDRTTSKRSTRSPASAAIRIRTISPIASSGPAIRRSSTSCTASGLPHLLLPHLQCRPRHAVAAGRLQAGPRVDRRAIELIKPGVTTDEVAACGRRRRSSAFPTKFQRSACSSVTGSACDCMSGRSSAACLDRPSDGDQGRHGVRAGDLLPGKRRLFGGAHRGRGRRHRQGLHVIYAVSGGGVADRGEVLNKNTAAGSSKTKGESAQRLQRAVLMPAEQLIEQLTSRGLPDLTAAPGHPPALLLTPIGRVT